MKILCCYTPAHELLVRDYFLPSVPAAFSVAPVKFDVAGSGDFHSPAFFHCIRRKIDLILDGIRENPGEVIAWSDIDIQFFDMRPDTLSSHLGMHDIAFQRDGRGAVDVNTGFFACRCGTRVSDFFLRVGEGLVRDPTLNDQHIIQQLLRDPTLDLSWTYLPLGYYSRTYGWPPPRSLALYHATGTAGKNGVERKIQQFQQLASFRRFPLPTLIYNFIRSPKRIFRLLSEHTHR